MTDLTLGLIIIVSYLVGLIIGALGLGCLMAYMADQGDLVLYVREGDSDNWRVVAGPPDQEREVY
jgi:hypothetical protein